MSNKTDKNRFELSVEETLDRLRRANDDGGWGIGEDVISALADSAPDWPEGRLAFRSLRIRFWAGSEGVALTFERHSTRMRQTISPRSSFPSFWDVPHRDSADLRLFAGNVHHRPTVEWIILNLGDAQDLDTIESLRDRKSVADEGLVFSWLYPEYMRAINYGKNPSFILAGYELNESPADGFSWMRVPGMMAHRSNLDIQSCDKKLFYRGYVVPIVTLAGVATETSTTPWNTFELSAEETLDRLRRANDDGGWGIGEDVISALADSAPDWPEGRLAFRSLRIRFGAGSEGVALTFERHAACIERIECNERINRNGVPNFFRGPKLRTDGGRLQLLDKNDIHQPAVEWVIIDLEADRGRGSVGSEVGQMSSLADEGLAFSWLFREYLRSIDERDYPALMLHGYQINDNFHSPGIHVLGVRNIVMAGSVCLDFTRFT